MCCGFFWENLSSYILVHISRNEIPEYFKFNMRFNVISESIQEAISNSFTFIYPSLFVSYFFLFFFFVQSNPIYLNQVLFLKLSRTFDLKRVVFMFCAVFSTFKRAEKSIGQNLDIALEPFNRFSRKTGGWRASRSDTNLT